MEDFLTIKDLSDTLKGEKARLKYISDLEQNKLNEKAIVYIKQWIDISSRH